MNIFKQEIEEWVNLNLNRGNCKISMFKTLVELGYNTDLIKNRLKIDSTGKPIEEKKTILKDLNFSNIRNFLGEVSEMIQVIDNIDTITKNLKIEDTPKVALQNVEFINTEKIDICRLRNFLTNEECDEIIDLINKSDLKDSHVLSASSPKDTYKDITRSSKTCYFDIHNDTINELEARIAKVMGINNQYGEKIQGQKYEVGQEFKKHVDYFGEHILKNNPSINGERTWTFMIYLNNVEEGGYTSFPYAYFASKPEKGTALIWNNLNNDKSPNEYATHMGMPIVKGEKYILTKWFEVNIVNPNIKNELCDNNFLPIFHPIGFEKIRVDSDIIKRIRSWMDSNLGKFESEQIDSIIKKDTTRVLDINNAPTSLRLELIDEMKNLLTKWIGYKSDLTHVATYGIREYMNGSKLDNHYDRINTHAFGIIIHLNDKSDEKWPLYIEDHNYKGHNICMEFGDVIFYESSTCKHGRPTEFTGDYHRNMYVHFKPERWPV